MISRILELGFGPEKYYGLGQPKPTKCGQTNSAQSYKTLGGFWSLTTLGRILMSINRRFWCCSAFVGFGPEKYYGLGATKTD
jgi:hypothetical protein